MRPYGFLGRAVHAREGRFLRPPFWGFGFCLVCTFCVRSAGVSKKFFVAIVLKNHSREVYGMAFDPAVSAVEKKAKLTLDQRIAQKEAELARLKERGRKDRNKRLILLGIVAEKAAAENSSFRELLLSSARRNLNSSDFEKVAFLQEDLVLQRAFSAFDD